MEEFSQVLETAVSAVLFCVAVVLLLFITASLAA